jgi:hypothetical protein
MWWEEINARFFSQKRVDKGKMTNMTLKGDKNYTNKLGK